MGWGGGLGPSLLFFLKLKTWQPGEGGNHEMVEVHKATMMLECAMLSGDTPVLDFHHSVLF